MRKIETVGLSLLAAGMISVGITGALVAFGEWTPYANEYATGLKFAGATDSGCGVELPTELGREAGLTVFYCEHENGWDVLPDGWYTTYYQTEDN